MRDFVLGLVAVAAMVSLYLGKAHAGGPISSVVVTAVDSGVDNAALASSPFTKEIITKGFNHVVLTIPMTDQETATKLNMWCKQTPDGEQWSPIPGCESTAAYTLTCGRRLWGWPASQGAEATFYVPVNADRVRCYFSGDTPGGTRLTVVGYRANL